MNKRILFLAIFIIFIILAGTAFLIQQASQRMPGDTANWNIYKSEEYGYKLKYPKDLVLVIDNRGPQYQLKGERIELLGRKASKFSINVRLGSEEDVKQSVKLFSGGQRATTNLVSICQIKGTRIDSQELNVETTRIFVTKNQKIYEFWFFGKEEDIQLYDKIVLTFEFIEIPAQITTTEKKYSAIVDEVLPANFDREKTDYSIGDLNLNESGQSTMVITAFSSNDGVAEHSHGEAYLILLQLDNTGSYKIIGDFDFTDYIFSRSSSPPTVKKFEDIDDDKQNEIIFNLGFEGASTLAEGIVDWDNSHQKLGWVKLQNEYGNIEKAIFLVGASVMHSDNYNINIDLDQDGNKEIIRISTQREYAEPTDLKPWEKAIPQASEEIWGWRQQERVYEWDGSKFVYSEELSKKSLSKTISQ